MDICIRGAPAMREKAEKPTPQEVGVGEGWPQGLGCRHYFVLRNGCKFGPLPWLLSWASLGCLGRRALNIYLPNAFLFIRPPVLWLCFLGPPKTLSPTKYSFTSTIWVTSSHYQICLSRLCLHFYYQGAIWFRGKFLFSLNPLVAFGSVLT